MQKTQGAIITNSNLSKRRTNASAEKDSEAKRQKRSSNRRARKSMKEKEARLQNKIKILFVYSQEAHSHWMNSTK